MRDNATTDDTALATFVVERATSRDVFDEIEVYVRSSFDSSVQVHRSAVERVVHGRERAVSLRAFRSKRSALCTTSDLTPRAVDALVDEASRLVELSERDEYGGLPASDDFGIADSTELHLRDADVTGLAVEAMIELARRCEAAMFARDRRVTSSFNVTMKAALARTTIANNVGFQGSFEGTYASLGGEAICNDAGGKKRNEYWFTSGRALADLASPEEVGTKAADRALAKLGARKIGTQVVPVVWDTPAAHALVAVVGEAASGESRAHGATFLRALEGGGRISHLVSMQDAPLAAGRVGSRPFDAEGVRSRDVALFADGVFSGFLYDSRSARMLGQRTTGGAKRLLGVAPAPAPSNLTMAAGDSSRSELYQDLRSGFIVTNFLGPGVEMTTGGFSRGATGFWVEGGQITHPVTEVNVSGNLLDILGSVDAVGDETVWLDDVAAPAFRTPSVLVTGL